MHYRSNVGKEREGRNYTARSNLSKGDLSAAPQGAQLFPLSI